MSKLFFNYRLLAILLPLILFGVGRAQEFRIESQVYQQGNNLPVAENVTLFSDGNIYHFDLANDNRQKGGEVVSQITIYDASKKTMVVLDPARKVRLDLLDLRIMKILDGVRRDTQQDNRSSFLVTDKFEEDADWSTGWVRLSSPTITYQFQADTPKDITILPQYIKYIDLFTQLIASDPHKVPPFPRLRLNQTIKKLGRIPTEVHVTLRPNPLFPDGAKAHSKHTVFYQLSKKDKERVESAKNQWMTYQPVDLAEFHGLPKSRKGILKNRIAFRPTSQEQPNPPNSQTNELADEYGIDNSQAPIGTKNPPTKQKLKPLGPVPGTSEKPQNRSDFNNSEKVGI